MALALRDALEMPLAERRSRHEQMLGAVQRHDIHNWYSRFVFDLTGERLRGPVSAEVAPFRAVESGGRVRPGFTA